MFRIKPTKNQTTAKHANLSPYPNNQLIIHPKNQSKLLIKPVLNQAIKTNVPKLGQHYLKNDKGPNFRGNNNNKNDISNKIPRNSQLNKQSETN